MGFFDFFSRKDADSTEQPAVPFFTNKVTRIVCNTDENGEFKCKKFISSSNNFSEENDLDKEDAGFGPDEFNQNDLEKEFQEMMGGFRFGFMNFEDFFKPFEGQFSRPHPGFQRPENVRHRSEKDSNIYEI